MTACVYQKLLADPHKTPIDAARLRAMASEHAGDMPRQSPQSDYACLAKPSEWRWGGSPSEKNELPTPHVYL